MPKRKCYSVREKLNLIDRVRNGEGQTKVAREMSVAESTLRGWLKDEAKLREFVDTVEESEGLARKRARTATDQNHDKALYNWFVQERAEGKPISGEIVRAQATKISTSETFLASNGWLSKWKRRHGISSVKTSGEIRSADHESADAFQIEFQQYVEEQGYHKEQIYNADETALFFKMLPDRTLATKDDPHKREGYKQLKNRVTFLFCTNWSGCHKLKPLSIGKSAKPRCFKHKNMNNLEVIYANSANAWMTAAIFKDWFFKKFVPEVRRHLRSKRLDERAVLLLDNCPAHPPATSLVTRDGKIHVYYLPKNTTSKIQPMDQSIIANFKVNFRRELIRAMVNSEESVPTFLQGLTLKDAYDIAGDAWKAVKPETVKNCWDHALVPSTSVEDHDEFLGFTDEEAEEAKKKLAAALADQTLDDFVEDWASLDQDEPTVALQTPEQLMAAQAEPDEEEDEEELKEVQPIKTSVKASQAVKGLQDALQYFESLDPETEDDLPMKILHTKNMLFFAKKKQAQSLKQKTLKDIFKN